MTVEIVLRTLFTLAAMYGAYHLGLSRGFQNGFKLAEKVWKPVFFKSLYDPIFESVSAKLPEKPS
jgi:hypothetical protein